MGVAYSCLHGNHANSSSSSQLPHFSDFILLADGDNINRDDSHVSKVLVSF